MNQLDELDYRIILSLADNKMNESEVSRQLFMHRNTVVNRCKKIKRITGLDPTNFYDLGKLVRIARE